LLCWIKLTGISGERVIIIIIITIIIITIITFVSPVGTES